jgi:hypothetical protein
MENTSPKGDVFFVYQRLTMIEASQNVKVLGFGLDLKSPKWI